MSEITRRDVLGRLAAAFVAGTAIERLDARQAHAMAQSASAGGTSVAKALTDAQLATLERLTELILPPEDGRPGALEAQVPAWIDSLLAVNDELKSRYVHGLAWLDDAMRSRFGSTFVAASRDQQTTLLDLIAYTKNRSAELDPGIDFFILARRMTVDGFYTSPAGMRDIYPGNLPRTEFTVPQEVYDYVLSRSPFGR